MEVWEKVKGYNYSVSNKGNVRNEATGYVSAGRKTGNGYRKISFYKNNKEIGRAYVHRLVADAFLPKGKADTEVNHIDGNRENNCVTNLEWVTSSGNTEHAVVTGALHPWGKTRKPIIATDITTGERRYFDSISKAEVFFGTRHISHVLSGKRRQAKGQVFSYAGGDA
jgi:hypothetical protein